MATEEDYKQDHPLVKAHKLLALAQRNKAHPAIIRKIQNQIEVLASSVVSNWGETEDLFPILDALRKDIPI
jgi:hypothetical protein